ncbi:hypothetical protein LY78DRAFT_538242, partial [Colletotrichum sublineola]
FAAQQQASRNRPGKNTPTIPSIRQYAREYGVSDTSIRRHLRTLRASGNLRASPPAALGRPRAITDAEDAALTAYIIW